MTMLKKLFPATAAAAAAAVMFALSPMAQAQYQDRGYSPDYRGQYQWYDYGSDHAARTGGGMPYYGEGRYRTYDMNEPRGYGYGGGYGTARGPYDGGYGTARGRYDNGYMYRGYGGAYGYDMGGPDARAPYYGAPEPWRAR